MNKTKKDYSYFELQGLMKIEKQEIINNKKTIASHLQTINEYRTQLSKVKERKKNFSVLIKSNLRMFEILRRFAELTTEGLNEGLGIDEKNSNDNLIQKLHEYSQHYDKNINKILRFCEEDIN